MIPYIDMHCDTLMQAYIHQKKDIFDFKESMVDIKRLKEGNCKAQFFAIFMPPLFLKDKLGEKFPKDDEYIRDNLEIFHHSIKTAPEFFAGTSTVKELEENDRQGKISGILTLEDGRAVEGKMERLEKFYNQGIRLISLTWNEENCFGSPNSFERSVMEKGLSNFGKEAVEEMNRLGILIDVSHLSDAGFWDTFQYTTKPFVASHSNCRSLNPHPRSMSDEMIRALAEKGGVIGINFSPKFLIADLSNQESKVAYLIAQIKHMKKIGGIDCVALGSDFDGIKGTFEIGSSDKIPILFHSLKKEGFTSGEIEKIALRNIQRVVREVWKS